jgi:hypothetical protein
MQQDPLPRSPPQDAAQKPAVDTPILGMSRARHPRCCLSLSRPIIDTIVSHLPATAALALSIGSGSGLLEQLIHTANPHLELHGVEVAGAENVYLPAEKVHRVVGSWQVCPLGAEANVWMFVYPRSPVLVRSYLDSVSNADHLEIIVWIGPVADWECFKSSFEVHGLYDETHGLAVPLTDFEIMVLVDPRPVERDSPFDQMVYLL